MNIMQTCPHASVNPSRVNEIACGFIKSPVNHTLPQKFFTVSIVVVLPKPFFFLSLHA